MDKIISVTPKSSSGGYAVFETNQKLHFVDYRTYWIYIFNFVLALILLALVSSTILQIIFEPTLATFLFAILTIASAFLLHSSRIYVANKEQKPLNDHKTIAIIDLKNQQLLDGKGDFIAPLEDVTISAAFHIGSSSMGVKAYWNKESLLLAKGNPFAGGTFAIRHKLKLRGLMKS